MMFLENEYVEHSQALSRLAYAASEGQPVTTYTHNYYRYPARFSDRFVREAILNFSKSNDLILDPFIGGGTTAVEAIANGRRVIGSDLSPLACFVAKVKTTPLGIRQESSVRHLIQECIEDFCLQKRIDIEESAIHLGNLHWQLRRAITHLRSAIWSSSASTTVRDFAICALLRTAQWALDNKRHLPSYSDFLKRLQRYTEEMLSANEGLRNCFIQNGWETSKVSKARLIKRSPAELIHLDNRLRNFGKINLVITSPPYLGVHVLYHRWQIQGRRETAAPFWIAKLNDQLTTSQYTFAHRHTKQTSKYFLRALSAFASVAKITLPGTPLIQLVSFSDREKYLSEYLNVIHLAGFEPCEVYSRHFNQPKWRSVPGRRWYNCLTGDSKGADQEVLLVHRRSRRA